MHENEHFFQPRIVQIRNKYSAIFATSFSFQLHEDFVREDVGAARWYIDSEEKL